MATTTNYGWTTPDNTGLVKDGASNIRTLGSSVDTTLFTALGGTYPGLRLVKKQTIGTAVSSVNVTSAFSATYDAYKIVVTGGSCSQNDRNFSFRLGASTTAYNYILAYAGYSGGAIASQPGNNLGAWEYVGVANGTDGISMNVELVNPFLAKWTTIRADLPGLTISGMTTGVHKAATSYTDFTITPNAGTLTGGTIYVYGYGAS